MTDSRVSRVFLCHASEDRSRVRRLARRLERDGFRPWIDVKDLLPGERWKEAITQALPKSRAVLVCLTQRACLKQGFVQREIRMAVDAAQEVPEGKPFLIPMRLEPCEVPFSLLPWQAVDLFAKGGYRRLVEALGPRAAASKPDTVERRSKPAVVPVRLRGPVDRVLITEGQLARRVRTVGKDIDRDFLGREMVVVALLGGAVMFLADLTRNLRQPLRLHFINVAGDSEDLDPGEFVFAKELPVDVRGRDVLVVDNLLASGKTLSRVLDQLRALRPRRIRTCVLLNKASRRTEPVEPDYVGFEVPDFSLVGYGLGFREEYRNLPFVGTLNPRYRMGRR